MRNPDNTARNPKQGSKRARARRQAEQAAESANVEATNASRVVKPNTAEAAAKARTATLEAQRLARRTDSPARSSNYEAANAARVLEIVAYIARMKSPEAALIAQALRSERPAVRRAVMNRLDPAIRDAITEHQKRKEEAQRLARRTDSWAEAHWSPDTATRPLQPLGRSPRTTTTPKARKAA